MSDLLKGSSLEKTFCRDVKEGTLIVSCGAKKSGKTNFMLAMLRACVEANAFDDYILIFPSLLVEQYDSYKWCMKQKEFTIYTGYHPSIIEKLYKRNLDPKKRKRTLLIIDDATMFCKDLMYAQKSSELVGVISQSRHIQVSTWVLLHSLRGIISPVLRENTGYLIVYSIMNERLLNAIWEEYLSIKIKFPAFEAWYNEFSSEKFKSFMLHTLPPVEMDIDSNNWQMTTRYRNLNSNDSIDDRGKTKAHIAASPPSAKLQTRSPEKDIIRNADNAQAL